MQNLNTVILAGFLTEDPKFRQMKDDVVFAAFRLATNHDYRNSDGDIVERAFFHNIVVKVQPTVKAIRNRLQSGSRILIHGRLEVRAYKKREG